MSTKTFGNVIAVAGVIAMIFCTGCNGGDNVAERFFKTGKYRFLSPEKAIARPDHDRLTWIIKSMGELDKTEDMYPNATRPGPKDWVYVDEDYVIGPTDVLLINIPDLYYEGVETSLQRDVSDSGYIDLPQLKDRIKAEGMTSMELTRAVEEACVQAGLLKEGPGISVSILARRQQTFSMMGAVMRPGPYNIVRRDMRLLDAIAMAGGVSQDSIEYIYVIRQAPAIRKSESAGPAGETQPATAPVNSAAFYQFAEVGNSPPAAGGAFPQTATAPAPYQPARPWVFRKGQWVRLGSAPPATAPTTAPRPLTQPVSTRPHYPARAARTLPAVPAPKTQPRDPFGWAQMEKADLVRVIAINLKKLQQGDYRMNIVLRENDIVRVPPLEIGEFYVMGEILRPGVYSLTGRKITIKMAMAAAGNLGPLAWPENSVLIRRIGRNQEQMVPLNIEKIIRGTDPDVYLKANDVIAVGTAWQSSFLAVMRNAFRMTYGFGFIYDRNFADPLASYPNSKRFKGL